MNQSTGNSTRNTIHDGCIDDDPCWGGPLPEEHDLPHLLRWLKSLSFDDDASNLIFLYRSKDYIAINKPPDLRMDGPHLATVHKLLTFYYPPPSIRQHCLSSSTLSKTNEINALWQAIKPLSKHNCVPDNTARPCHQLDYATSGVLLVAMHRSAAAKACRCFEDRDVEKIYLAVVHGHVNTSLWPKKNGDKMMDRWRDDELAYRKKRENTKGHTFVGFLPSHAVFERWKSSYIKNKPIDVPTLTREEKNRVRRMKWCEVKENKIWRDSFEKLAQEMNNDIREIQLAKSRIELQEKQYFNGEPHIFCIDDDENLKNDVFYVDAAVAQVPGEFHMVLEPTVNQTSLSSMSDDLVFKPAITKCTVIAKGYYGTMKLPVTKMMLKPLTGRRHQLRLHMAACGHPIMGDATYSKSNNFDDTNLFPRMCLHAWKLSLHKLNLPTFVAPDPFKFERIDEEGIYRCSNFRLQL